MRFEIQNGADMKTRQVDDARYHSMGGTVVQNYSWTTSLSGILSPLVGNPRFQRSAYQNRLLKRFDPKSVFPAAENLCTYC